MFSSGHFPFASLMLFAGLTSVHSQRLNRRPTLIPSAYAATHPRHAHGPPAHRRAGHEASSPNPSTFTITSSSPETRQCLKRCYQLRPHRPGSHSSAPRPSSTATSPPSTIPSSTSTALNIPALRNRIPSPASSSSATPTSSSSPSAITAPPTSSRPRTWLVRKSKSVHDTPSSLPVAPTAPLRLFYSQHFR